MAEDNKFSLHRVVPSCSEQPCWQEFPPGFLTAAWKHLRNFSETASRDCVSLWALRWFPHPHQEPWDSPAPLTSWNSHPFCTHCQCPPVLRAPSACFLRIAIADVSGYNSENQTHPEVGEVCSCSVPPTLAWSWSDTAEGQPQPHSDPAHCQLRVHWGPWAASAVLVLKWMLKRTILWSGVW